MPREDRTAYGNPVIKRAPGAEPHTAVGLFLILGELVDLAVPIELAYDRSVLPPVGLDLDEEFEEDMRAEDRLEFLARERADFLHGFPALADENHFLTFAFDIESRADPDQFGPLIEIVYQHGNSVGNFFASLEYGLLTDHLSGEKPLGLVADLVGRDR